MSYLKFAYPKKGKDLTDLKPETSIPPDVVLTPIGGMHYFTWRNATARDAMKEKEGVSSAVKHNPEPIPENVTTRYQDQNFIQTVQPLQLFRPGSLTADVRSSDKKRMEAGLKKIVRSAHEEKLKVKAVGSGHSFSDIMTTPDFLVITDDLNRMLTMVTPGSDAEKEIREINIRHYPLLNEEIRESGYAHFKNYAGDDDHRPALVEFEAGIKLTALNEELWKRGWSLYNLGTYQGQSFIGAVSTSTHGSGQNFEPLPDMIKSLVIVADEGITYRVEPAAGISNTKGLLRSAPAHFSPEVLEEVRQKKGAIYKAQRDLGVDFLIQDDDFFNASLVNVGTFGVVYSVIVEVIPQFCLIETAEVTTWTDLRARLLDATKWKEIFETKEYITSELKYKLAYPDADPEKNINAGDPLKVKNIRQASILYSANEYDGEHFFRITRLYEISSQRAHENGWIDENDEGRLLSKEIKAVAQLSLDKLGEKLERNAVDQEELYREKLRMILSNVVFAPLKKNKTEADILLIAQNQSLFHDTAEIERLIAETKLQPWESGEKDFYINRNYRVYLKSSDLNGYGIETGFRVDPEPNEPLPPYIAAIDRSLTIANEHWKEGRYMQTATTAVRLVKASNAYLSPQYGETTCMIEMLNVADTHGGKELFYRYQTEFLKMGGRPHWGLDLSVTTGNNNFLSRAYHRFSAWKKVYDLFNHHGTFDNRFTDRMGLSVQAYPH
jgi:hypothetical protein